MKLELARPRMLLATLRLAGAGTFILPRIGAHALALDASPQSAYVVRLFAARNAALTAGLLLSGRRARRLWWQAGIACDALDVLAAALAVREGKPRTGVASDAAASLVATALGVAGLLADRDRGRG